LLKIQGICHILTHSPTFRSPAGYAAGWYHPPSSQCFSTDMVY